MKTNTIDRALLIGYGSVGKKHARCLSQRYGSLIIVDQHPAARADAKKAFPDALLMSSMADLASLPGDWGRTMAVIATWGPSHYPVWKECIERGVRNVVCEKPLAVSLFQGDRMVKDALAFGVTLGVNHTRRFLGVDEGLRRLAERFSLGDPQSIALHGGASGLVTNGIHYIDLANALMNGFPHSVVSTAHGDAINPRSPELLFFGGSAIWRYEGGREATFALSNRSSVFPTFSVYYDNAVIHLRHHRHVQALRREPGSIEPGAPPTRTGHAAESLYCGPLPGSPLAFEDAFVRLYEEVEAGQLVTMRPEDAYQALQACVGALIAGERGSAVDFPIDPSSDAGRREWPIS